MITSITIVFILICLIEAVLITREVLGTPRNTKLEDELLLVQQDNRILSEKLQTTEQKLEAAEKEIQGIHLLWNKAIQSEQKMRRDLDIARTQMTYLAHKALRMKSETKAYWSEEEEAKALDATPIAERTPLRAFHSSELVQREFI